MTSPIQPPPKRPPVSGRILTWWFALMSAAGVLFGAFADRRPFGDDVLAHPLVALFVVVGLALLALRVALRRPVPEIIPDRLLVVGCVVGLAAFLIGNWLAVHLRAL
jgi:cytochrome b561